MRWRVGLADVSAALIVAVVIVLPPREAKVANAYYDNINKVEAPAEAIRSMGVLQAEIATNPADTIAADELSELLASFGQTDDALRVAGSAALKAAANPKGDRWRALLAIATVHADRIEFGTARTWTDKALEACNSAAASCRGDSSTRIKIFADELDRAIKAVEEGHNPRIDPEGFREAMGERRLPPVRVN